MIRSVRRRLLSAILSVTLLLPSVPFSVFATNAPVLDPNSVPPVLDYEEAVAAGHIARAYQEESSLNQLVFRNADNTATAYLFNENVKYTADDGTVRDKSNQLVRLDDGSYTNPNNDITVTYPNDITSGVTMEWDDISLHLTPAIRQTTPSLSPASYQAATPNVITYNGVFGENTILRYTQDFSVVKEDIILTSAAAPTEFTFRVVTRSLRSAYRCVL